MKGILTSILFLFSILAIGQSVPNTSTFSLQDGYDVVHGENALTSGNLSSCFTYSTSGEFDPNYDNDSYAPANSLLRFRNYGNSSSYLDWPTTTPQYSALNAARLTKHYGTSRDGYNYYIGGVGGASLGNLIDRFATVGNANWEMGPNNISLIVGNEYSLPYSEYFGVAVSPDETKYILVSYVSTDVGELSGYSLTSSGDLTTSSPYSTYTFSGVVGSNAEGALYIPDSGNMAFVAAYSTSNVYIYYMSTAWDPSSVYSRIGPYNYSSYVSNVTGMSFADDGHRFFIAGMDGSVAVFDVPTAYNLSSRIYATTLDFSGDDFVNVLDIIVPNDESHINLIVSRTTLPGGTGSWIISHSR